MEVIVCGRWNRHCSSREETRKLHLVRNRYDSDKASLKELMSSQDEVTALLVRELEGAGVNMLGDGMIRWDSIFDIAHAIDGCCEFDQLTRIPKTNHFHRQPVAKLPLLRKKSILKQDLAFVSELTEKPVVMCLPGPYGLSLQTRNMPEIGLEKLAYAYAEVLNQEIRDLLANGAMLVRVEEPHILDHVQDFGLFKDTSARLLDGVDTLRVALATWFGDTNTIPGYFDLPFGTFFVDFIGEGKSVEALRNFPCDKQLVAGIVDARHTYRESFRQLRDLASCILQHVSSEQLLISTQTDLHFLPWEEAILKVKRLVRFAHEY